MNYIKISKTDIANGDGVRVVLWVAGCTVNCPGCHNQAAQDFNCGQPFDEAALEELMDALGKPWVMGLTLSGGHPLDPKNIMQCADICQVAKYRYPEKDIWVYTGYTLEDIERGKYGDMVQRFFIEDMKPYIDVLVDGPFIEPLRDISLKFRGSSNQRIIRFKEGNPYES